MAASKKAAFEQLAGTPEAGVVTVLAYANRAARLNHKRELGEPSFSGALAEAEEASALAAELANRLDQIVENIRSAALIQTKADTLLTTTLLITLMAAEDIALCLSSNEGERK